LARRAKPTVLAVSPQPAGTLTEGTSRHPSPGSGRMRWAVRPQSIPSRPAARSFASSVAFRCGSFDHIAYSAAKGSVNVDAGVVHR
jgi:hypothetical protein